MIKKIESILRAEETEDELPPYRTLPVGSKKWIEIKAMRIAELYKTQGGK